MKNVKIKKFFAVLIFLFVLLVFLNPVSAATALKAKPAQKWHCLEVVKCGLPRSDCADGPEVVHGHRAKLTTKSKDLPTKNAQTTPFVCVATQEGNICTSGDDDWDLQTVGYRGLSKLAQLTNYEFQGLFGKKGTIRVSPRDIYTNSQGKLSIITNKQVKDFQLFSKVFAVASPVNKYEVIEPLEMQDYTPTVLHRKWVALNLIDEPPKSEKGQGGQQQGAFTFEGALARCASLAWDPYGIVFDSQSLEPIMGARVSLLKKRDGGRFTLADGEDTVSILNPITTIEDGQFEFYVPDGIYKLDISAPNFVFPNTIALNPNYIKIYSDIYRGEEIVQKGEIQHRDVPVDSKGKPYQSEIKVLGYSSMFDKQTNSIVIEGRVSHPLAKINVYGKKPSENGFVRTKLLTTATANKQAQFKIDHNLNRLDITEMVGDIEFIKPNYKDLNNETSVETTKKKTILSIEPILNHLEGYAYDQNKKPLVNAVVGVYLNFSNKPAYETITDQNGFYQIASEDLPEMSYGIRYTTADNRVIPIKTSEFVAQNAKYLEAKKTNLFVFKNRNGETPTTTEREKNNNNKPFNNTQTDGQTSDSNVAQKQPVKKNTATLLPIVLILIILGAGSLAVVLYLIKKGRS